MEQNGDSQSRKRNRVSWKDINVVRTFLEVCIFEVAINGREGGSLKSLSWTKVAEALKSTHGFIVDRKQMKNRYDYLKGKYTAWLKLRNKTGNVYDSSTNTFNLTSEEWESEMKSNRYVETLRHTSLPFPELCAKLFDGAVATGNASWGPSSSVSEPIFDLDINSEVLEIPNIQETSPTPCLSRPRTEKTKKKVKQEVDEEIMGVLHSLVDKHGETGTYTFADCKAKLDELQWDKNNPLYAIALAIVSEHKNYREAWMEMDSECVASWVMMIGRKNGFM